ncbi:aminoglycoside 6-adenylyltransferase [Brasilonema sp. UFV-L1]|uniref:aminoglycoside 6-adenylyltransferase n=1 Tax=Brasilonema sp. UFV-L1 TaxID=2234130 RepID=UPI00145DA265|nr:aminoglycoside 6-adenylyltransferase [Brasilonema sp. UFV-L1]NMG11169.1 sigma-70 family RNA polymerase sigma factor [Brasilonema sp. UFV-L1]
MNKRQSIVQKFSTFLSFLSPRKSLIHQWITESELERNIKQQVQTHPEKTAELWALYFLSILQSKSQEEEKSGDIGEQKNNRQFVDILSSIHYPVTTQYSFPSQHLKAEKHLSAYLQEACYQAAKKIQKQFQSIQYKYSLEDLFQIGNLFVSQPAKLFRSFKLEYQDSSLESYAKTAIYRFIGNTIYTQDVEAKREKFSDYGLLKDLNNKELKEALASKGINTSQLDSYCLARQCFHAVYQPQKRQSSRSLESPSQEDLTQIASCYNQRHNQLNLPTVLADSKKIQEMLSTCIQAARDYRTKRVLTLENDDIISDPMPTPWDIVTQTEETEQIESLVSKIFTTIPEIGQTMLKLWLGLNLTQAEIATVLKHKYPELKKQYQVARQLGKYSRNFLKEFLQQCHQLNPEMSLQNDKDIELIQESLDECLQSYCQRLLYAYLEQLTQQYYSEDEFLILTDLIHNEQPGYEQTSKLIEKKQGFIQAFEKQLEKNMNLSPESLKFVNRKIAGIVSEWLQSSVN